MKIEYKDWEMSSYILKQSKFKGNKNNLIRFAQFKKGYNRDLLFYEFGHFQTNRNGEI